MAEVELQTYWLSTRSGGMDLDMVAHTILKDIAVSMSFSVASSLLKSSKLSLISTHSYNPSVHFIVHLLSQAYFPL